MVYVSDAYPDLVFKLQKSANQRRLKRYEVKSYLIKRWPGFDHFIVRQEYKAYVKMCLSVPDVFDQMPVAKMYGFVPSTGGVLQVAEKMTLDGKTLGPTYGEVGRNTGFSPADIEALNRFATNLLKAGLPTNDINSKNIVKGRDQNGREKFVLIDGIGDLHVLPFKTLSHRRRRAHLVKMFLKMTGKRLIFDPESFTFCAAVKV